MTQKANLFKGHQKKAPAANRHGRTLRVKKGTFDKGPKNRTKEFLASKELTKFINSANEAKVAAVASKDGGQLKFVTPGPDSGKTPTKNKRSILTKGKK